MSAESGIPNLLFSAKMGRVKVKDARIKIKNERMAFIKISKKQSLPYFRKERRETISFLPFPCHNFSMEEKNIIQ